MATHRPSNADNQHQFEYALSVENLPDRKFRFDRGDKILGLFDCPSRVFRADGIAAVIGDLPKPLRLVEGFAMLSPHMASKHNALTERGDKPTVSLDRRGELFEAKREKAA
jgi:hypothetical protein